MTAPQVAKSEVDEVKAWINHKAAKAIRQVDECVRFVEQLRAWMAYERHLLESCDQPGCDDCNARTWLLGRLESLRIPVLPPVGAEPAEEVPDERNASDPGGRPGHVTPDP